MKPQRTNLKPNLDVSNISSEKGNMCIDNQNYLTNAVRRTSVPFPLRKNLS